MTETDLIKACIKKDPKAEKLLWERFAPKLFGVCLRHCRTQTEAEEVLQESFIKIFDKLHQFQFEGSFEGWLKRITVHTALTHLRLTQKFTLESDASLLENDILERFEPIEQLAFKDLLQTIQQLPENYKVVLNLFCIDGYSHQEIAQQLGISEANSRVYLYRAKQLLIQKLQINKREGVAYDIRK